MKIIIATFPHQQEALNRRQVRRRLLSFADLKAPGVLRKLEGAPNVTTALAITPADGQELMLDSGAYAAWKRGIGITLDEYSAFVLRHSKSFTWIVNLDVIPGAWGRKPSATEIDRSAAIGWDNFRALKQALGPEEGAKLIHVFHQGEHKRWLTKILDEGGPYVGISPGNDRGRKRGDWLEIIRPHMVYPEGRPRRKYHAFGVTAPEILARHLWLDSADSSSWARAAQFGNCSIAIPTPGRADYKMEGVRARTISFSRRRSNDPQHFANLSKAEQALVVVYLRGTGIEIPEGEQPLNISKRVRAEVNLQYFLNLERFLEMMKHMGLRWAIRFNVMRVSTHRPADTSIIKALS